MTKLSGGKFSGMNLRGSFSALPDSYASWKMGLRFTENDPLKVLITSGAVETVYDQSGQGRDYTQSVSASRPSFTVGVGATFNDQFLESVLNMPTDSAGTLFMVVRFDRANTEEYLFSKGDSTVVDGNAYSWRKNSTNEKRSVLATGVSPGIQGNIMLTDTTNFRVLVFQMQQIYQNSAQEDISVIGAGGNNLWFNSPSGGTQRMCIARRSGSQANYGRFTCKSIDYMNVTLANQDIIKIVNGLKTKYGI